MRLHISYNTFNGLEFLKPNLLNMRQVVDEITVVWQHISNYGNPAETDIEAHIKQLKKQGLIDHEICYKTDLDLGGARNEFNKRKLGLNQARKTGCSHHLDLDVDEFYFAKQMEFAKQQIEQQNCQTSYCKIVEYHKDVQYKCKQLRTDLYAPFIMKSSCNLKFRATVPLLIDPKRRAVPNDDFYLFQPKELLMHHYTLVRQNFTGKFTDANNRLRNQDRIKAVRHFNEQRYTVVDNYFNI